jgi:SAM-dependent methyltransferase
MDFADPHQRAVFFDVHTGLPREAPGSAASTERALGLIPDPDSITRVLDIGCGPGAQTLDLARLLPGAHITAIDLHAPYLAALNRAAAAAGLGPRIETRAADMAALPFEDGAFDLIWCEGAAYNMGVPAALAAWKPLLAPGGALAFTEAVWLKPDPPAPVRAMWAEYPAMTDVATCRRLVAQAGYRLRGDFVLPASDWWTYYTPMEERLERLRKQYSGDAAALAVLAESAAEIATYRNYGDFYGYAFFVLA